MGHGLSMSRTADSLAGWHPEDVKAAIRKRGVTLTDLSLRNNYSEAYLRNALLRPLFEAEQIIARFLGVPADAIWPDRYTDGQPDYAKWRHLRDSRLNSKKRAA
jgi:Ner family transcriptional regulator